MPTVLFNPYNSLWQSSAVVSPINKAEMVKRFAWSHTTNKQLSQDSDQLLLPSCAIQKTT